LLYLWQQKLKIDVDNNKSVSHLLMCWFSSTVPTVNLAQNVQN